jgi:hypothetical protein
MSEKSIIEKLGIISGTLKIRKTTDDSGDYIIRRYDILNEFPWGCNGICYDIDNPNHARLFASAPEMLEALIDMCRFMVDMGYSPEKDNPSIQIIEKATGKSWEEIKELMG